MFSTNWTACELFNLKHQREMNAQMHLAQSHARGFVRITFVKLFISQSKHMLWVVIKSFLAMGLILEHKTYAARGDLCRKLMSGANNQVRQNVGPDLDPNRLTL